jgi:hypothetical protein
MAGGFGTRFNAVSRSALRKRATPPTGNAPEAIWHQFYDTQVYPAAGVTRQTFFGVTSTDPTISNMPSAGQFPDPQWLSIWDITLDVLSQNSSVVGVTDVTGEYNDLAQLLKQGRGTWTLTISDKRYGPYSLTLLHATGGPVGTVFPGTTVGTGNQQSANNALNPGWNYKGSLIIPPKTNFLIELAWQATVPVITVDTDLRISLHGILSRRTL